MILLSQNQHQALYTDVRQRDILFDFINTNGGQTKLYVQTSMVMFTSNQEVLDKDYMGWYWHGKIIKTVMNGQILPNFCFWNDLKMNIGHNLKMDMVLMRRAIEKEIAKYVVRPAKLIPIIHVKAV